MSIDGSPPSSNAVGKVRRVPVFTRLDRVLFPLFLAIHVAAAVWFFAFWLRQVDTGWSAVAFASATLLICYALATNTFRWLLLPMMRRPVRMPVDKPGRVGVATTFVPGAEPIEMLESTVRALVAMNIEHDTWVLDEGDSPEVKELCARLGARHFSRKGRPAYQADSGTYARRTKHGNYNAWLDAVAFERYDVIVGFDPDHVPKRSFLEASLGYLADPSIGYVQLPQVYYNQSASFIARGAAEETYAYYSATQMASYALGFPIVTGCHNVHRTTALEEVGGFAAHDADDLLIALLYRSAGWQGVYVPEVQAVGLTPTDWPTYLKQQLRWARSVLDVKFRAYPRLVGKLPLVTRGISLLHGLYYLQEAVIGAGALALLVVLLTTGMQPRFLAYGTVPPFLALVALMFATDFYRQRFFLLPEKEWGMHLRARFLRFVKWPYLFFGLYDAITGRKRPYSITRKVATSERLPFMTWPHWVVSALLIAAWGVGVLRGVEHHPLLLSWVVLSLLASLAAFASELLRPVPPFETALLESAGMSLLRDANGGTDTAVVGASPLRSVEDGPRDGSVAPVPMSTGRR